MLLTKGHYDTATGFLTGTHVAAIRQKILNASVKLQGIVGKGTFTGSATILGVGVEVAYNSGTEKWAPTTKQFTVVMTCKHSLYIKGNDKKVPDTNGTPKWDQDLVSGFKSIEIFYSDSGTNGFGSDLTKRAAIDHVIPIFEENVGAETKMIAIPATASSDGTAFTLVNLTGTTTPNGSGTISGSGGISPVTPANGWMYDVMILLSKDPTLYAFANGAGNCDFQAGATQDQLVQALSAYYGKYGNSKPIVPVLNRANIQLVQTGFGTVTEQLLPKNPKEDAEKITLPTGTKAGAMYGRLQYKLSTPATALETARYYDYLPGDSGNLTLTNTHGFLQECDGGNNSTNSGDSGGGVFAIKKNPTAAVQRAPLVAVTSGSGSATSEDDAPKMWDFDNNVVTSLGFYYENLFNLRFQNV